MRVLVVSQYFWPEGFRINEVTKTLVEKGVLVDVLTGKPNYPEGKIFAGYRMGAFSKSNIAERTSAACHYFHAVRTAVFAWR